MNPDETITDDLIIEIAPYHNNPTILINFDHDFKDDDEPDYKFEAWSGE